MALATPAEWVTQTASATKKPSTSGDSPMSGPPSGVKEKMPLKPSSIWAPRRAGRRSLLSSHEGAKSSMVKSRREGMRCSDISSAPTRGSRSMFTGMGRCA